MASMPCPSIPPAVFAQFLHCRFCIQGNSCELTGLMTLYATNFYRVRLWAPCIASVKGTFWHTYMVTSVLTPTLVVGLVQNCILHAKHIHPSRSESEKQNVCPAKTLLYTLQDLEHYMLFPFIIQQQSGAPLHLLIAFLNKEELVVNFYPAPSSHSNTQPSQKHTTNNPHGTIYYWHQINTFFCHGKVPAQCQGGGKGVVLCH